MLTQLTLAVEVEQLQAAEVDLLLRQALGRHLPIVSQEVLLKRTRRHREDLGHLLHGDGRWRLHVDEILWGAVRGVGLPQRLGVVGAFVPHRGLALEHLEPLLDQAEVGQGGALVRVVQLGVMPMTWAELELLAVPRLGRMITRATFSSAEDG